MSTASIYKESKCRPLYLIIGPSGSGKSTIVDRVCQVMRVNRVTSCTTRPRRVGEPEDEHYFINDAAFDMLTKSPYGMAATTTYDGYRYGATWAEVESGDLYIIDPAGAASLDRERLGRPVVEVYVDSASELERRHNMIARGDSPEDAERRIEHDRPIYAEYFAGRTWKHSIITEAGRSQEDAAKLAQIIIAG